MSVSRFSVIVPTLNAARYLTPTLQSICSSEASFELILVDGGSKDATLRIAEEYNAKVVSAQKGRGFQLNEGAKKASGEILLFLHADTKLPFNALDLLNIFFMDSEVDVCKFRMKFDKQHWLLNVYAFMTRFDSLWTSFGDQCIIVRKSFFEKIGGFPHWPIFEDVHFFQKARRQTKIHTMPVSVQTSARRFLKNGIIRQQLRNGWFIAQYLKGVSPEKLYQKYYS